MRKIVYNALYHSDKNIKAPNTKITGGAENYIKQSFVSLKSVRLSNPDAETWIVTNQKLPERYQHLFSEHNIRIEIVPFDDFCVPSDWRWEYAFYKLKALDYMVRNSGADYLLGLDTDTYVALKLDGFWKECGSDRPILSPLPFDGLESGRKRLNNDYQKVFGLDKSEYIVQYGGEFMGGSRIALQMLVKEIRNVYQRIQEKNYEIDKNSGDEAFLSMAAHQLKCNSAVPYVRRYWSRKKWYEVDSAWFFVPVWHLPSEKNYGMNIMYNKLVKGKSLSIKQSAKLFNLPIQKKYTLQMLRYYCYNMLLRKKKSI